MLPVPPVPMEAIARAVALFAPFEPDPSRALLAPGPGAAHTAERVVLARSPGWRLTPRRPNGATVVYGHGAGSEKLLANLPLFEAWLAAGYTIFTYALPGYDQHPEPLATDTALACVVDVLNAIRTQPGVEPGRIGYFAISLGAALLLRAAQQLPWLRAMVLFGTPLRMPAADADLWRELFGTYHPASADVLGEAPAGRCAVNFLAPVRCREGGQQALYQRSFIRRIDAILADVDPLDAAAHLPPIPTRFIQGEWDALVPPATTRTLQAAIPGPSEIAWFPRRTHTTLLYDRAAAASSVAWFDQYLCFDKVSNPH